MDAKSPCSKLDVCAALVLALIYGAGGGMLLLLECMQRG
jgi:hypothetical protein